MHPKQIKSELQENGGWVFLAFRTTSFSGEWERKEKFKEFKKQVGDPSNISDFPMFPAGSLLAIQISVGFPKINKAKYV